MGSNTYQSLLTERERVIAFNEGLKCSVYILESVSFLSCEAIRSLTEELERQIAESEIKYTVNLLKCLR